MRRPTSAALRARLESAASRNGGGLTAQAPRAPREWAKSVRVPTFLYQVHDDVLTYPSDVQTMFDNIPITDKKLLWIKDTTARWDGYLEFQRRPEPMLEWFQTHMA